MIDFKKLDDKDFVFINKPLNEKDDKAFSDFLKARKEKSLRAKKKNQQKELQSQ